MIYYKTDEEIELMRAAGLLNCKALAHVASIIRPGITGLEINAAAEELLRDHGAVPGFLNYGNPPFPGTLCISINEGVVHGIPTDYVFQDGDVVSVDCGTILNGFYGDAAYTFALGNVAEDTMQLLRVTKTSLYKGIEKAVVGNRMGDVSWAIQEYTEREHGYSIVRELVGHGVGRNLHEPPEVPNYGKRGRGVKLKEGLVIAIEPMVNLGKRTIAQSDDGWTIIAKDRKPSAHFEHTITVKTDKADILTDHKPLEAEILKNDHVNEVALLDEALAY